VQTGAWDRSHYGDVANDPNRAPHLTLLPGGASPSRRARTQPRRRVREAAPRRDLAAMTTTERCARVLVAGGLLLALPSAFWGAVALMLVVGTALPCVRGACAGTGNLLPAVVFLAVAGGLGAACLAADRWLDRAAGTAAPFVVAAGATTGVVLLGAWATRMAFA
jgi:hypothetical protein